MPAQQHGQVGICAQGRPTFNHPSSACMQGMHAKAITTPSIRFTMAIISSRSLRSITLCMLLSGPRSVVYMCAAAPAVLPSRLARFTRD